VAVISLEPDHIIKAVCCDARHTRDKVAEIATFGRFTLDNGELRWLILGRGGRWRYTPPDGDGVYRRYRTDSAKGATYSWPCTLCPRRLRVREDTLQQVLENTYRGLLKTRPGKHVSAVPISVLRQVASQVARPQ
jgi:hypothetical protein